MGITDKLKSMLGKKETKKPSKKKQLSEKELATKNNEPYVSVLSMEIDKDNPSDGAFELDWNDIFVARLMKAGYQGKTDNDIVDNWFQSVCRNVVMENFENEQADPELRKQHESKRDLGNGRSDHS